MRSVFHSKLLISAVAVIVSGFAYAHTGADGVVRDRMDMMGEIARSMKTIGRMIKGEADYDAEAAQAAALEIYGHMSHMPEMFPEGSIEPPTEALPIIWQEWDEFVVISDKLKTDAKQLAELTASVSGANELIPQFSEVGKSCAACHEKFRLKK